MINNIKVAFAFLTRVPIKHSQTIDLSKSAVWFPFVGFFIGLFGGLVFYLSSQFLPSLVGAVLALISTVLLTGAFHQDGLADIFDGLVGGWDPDQRLKILKDSRHGTYGVLALVLQIFLQIVTLAQFSPEQGLAALVIMHTLARLMPIYLMLAPAAPNNQGMGASLTREVNLVKIVSATSLTLLLTLPIVGQFVFGLIAVSLTATWLFWIYVKSKILGVVGDAFGAAEQISESLTLMALLVLTQQGISWMNYI